MKMSPRPTPWKVVANSKTIVVLIVATAVVALIALGGLDSFDRIDWSDSETISISTPVNGIVSDFKIDRSVTRVTLSEKTYAVTPGSFSGNDRLTSIGSNLELGDEVTKLPGSTQIIIRRGRTTIDTFTVSDTFL